MNPAAWHKLGGCQGNAVDLSGEWDYPGQPTGLLQPTRSNTSIMSTGKTMKQQGDLCIISTSVSYHSVFPKGTMYTPKHMSPFGVILLLMLLIFLTSVQLWLKDNKHSVYLPARLY